MQAIENQIKECPILFSASLVRAILEGRKTQTRRAIKGADGLRLAASLPQSICGSKTDKFLFRDGDDRLKVIRCPYGEIGDRLWVRETFGQLQDEDGGGYVYRADLDPDGNSFIQQPWKPSIHMPRAASRILLEITNIRVERLQEISEENCLAEGVWREKQDGILTPSGLCFANYITGHWTVHAKHSFQTLWQSINGPESWNTNPFVWVIEFQKIN